MPEGPEVTIVAENLNKLLKNKYIHSYQLTDNGRYRKKGPDNCIPFGDSLPLKVMKVENKGKLIFFTFTDGKKEFYMLNTLGMSGVWHKQTGKHTCFVFEYSSSPEEENGKEKIYFIDQRHFGTIKFLTSKEDLDKKLKDIGPDMLNDSKMSLELFKERMMKYKHWNLSKVVSPPSMYILFTS